MNGNYNDYGCEQIGNINAVNATFRTHVYNITDYYQNGSWHTSNVWFPSAINDASCPYTLLLEDLNATSVDETGIYKPEIQIRPNPANSQTILHYVLPQNTQLNIKLFDATGNLVRNVFNGKVSQGIYNREIFLEELATGLYLIQVQSDDFSATEKLIKQ